MPDLEFRQRVKDIVANIPKGQVMTYKEVAIAAGKPLAARAVGAIMRKNYDPNIPCHRVVGSDGKLRGYNRGGIQAKLARLREEEVPLYSLRDGSVPIR